MPSLSHWLSETILLKKGIRTDRIWTHPWAYRSFLAYIPLFLDTWALLTSQYWSRAQLDAYRDKRLVELFEHASRVAYWRERLDGHDASRVGPYHFLKTVPITRKRELVQQARSRIVYAPLSAKSAPDNTSGSTGKPFHFAQDWHACLRSFAVTERIFRAISRRYPVVYMRARERNGFTFYKHIWFFLRGFSSIPYRIEEFESLAKRLSRGFILYGYTSWVVELARYLESRGTRLPLRAAVVAGEHISAGDAAYVERVFGTELYSLYASRETGFLAFECREHRLHVSEEWAHLEIVDDAGEPVPPGTEGKIIVTTFDNQVMPFIRYEIGDRGVISDEACPCGRTLRTLTFKGRTSELIELEDDRTVSLLDISFMLGHYRDSIRQYQLIQKSRIAFVVRIIPGPLFEDKREHIEALVIRLLHPRARITWELVDTIPEAPSGKAVYFIRDFS